MRYGFLALGALAAAQNQTCETEMKTFAEGNFWLIGDPDTQKSKVEEICCAAGLAGAACPAKEEMLATLGSLASTCGATGGTESMLVNMINKLLCSNHDGVYCLTNVLALFDINYLLGLQNGNVGLPDVSAALAIPARATALCSSHKCQYEVFRKISDMIGDSTSKAPMYDLSHAITCGCAADGSGGWCADSFATQVVAGAWSAAEVCVDGEVSKCARINAHCNGVQVDPALCDGTNTVARLEVASFTVNLPTVTYAFYLANQAGFKAAMESDLASNFIALVPGDLTLTFRDVAGALAIDVKISGEDLTKVMSLLDLLQDGQARALLGLIVMDKLEEYVPVGDRTTAAMLSDSITISDVVAPANDPDTSDAAAVVAVAVVVPVLAMLL